MTRSVELAQVASSNQTFRNWIVNGGFDVWQRGTPITGVNTWTADRFFNTNTSMTWTRANNTLGGPCPYMCTLTGGDSSSRFRFSFELPSSTNQSPFTVGSYWTLSLYTDFNLTGRTMDVGFADQPNGTTDTCSTTGTWVSLGGNRWSLTVQINATNSNNRLAMRFSGPFNGPVNHGVASISITGVQFEAGTAATNFEQRPIEVELALCQRYYYNIFGTAADFQAFGCGVWLSSTVGKVLIDLPVPLRVVPTLEAASLRLFDAAASTTRSATGFSIAYTVTATNKAFIDVSVGSSSASAGDACLAVLNTSTSARVGFSAEL